MRRTASPAPGCAPLVDDVAYDPLTDDFESKERNYIHFDLPLSEAQRSYASLAHIDLAKHAFWPLLGFTKVERRTEALETGRLSTKIKPRNIKFGSHKDAALLELYAQSLGARYEQFLSRLDYAGSVLAYRSGVGDNVTQAADLFDEIDRMGSVTAIAMDVKSFFDSINHDVLFSALQKTLGTDRLETADFKVFQRMTKFEWVEIAELEECLGRRGAVRGRLCSAAEFRTLVRTTSGDSIIKKNSENFGIPQGTPVSGLYANIAMIEFDRIMYGYVSRRGGSYRRYSDDLAILVPSGADVRLVLRHIKRQLRRLGLRLNENKTEISVFSSSSGGLVADRPFQYLGFTYDGSKKLIRNSSLARYYRKMKRGVRVKIKVAAENDVPRDRIFMRELFRLYTHFGKKRNFPRYAYRAARILKAPEIRSQIRGHMRHFKKLVRHYTHYFYGP